MHVLSGARAGLALGGLGAPGLTSSAGKAKEADEIALVHLQLQARSSELPIMPCHNIRLTIKVVTVDSGR